MNLEYVPLLMRYRDLYGQPRDMARFRSYLDVLTTADHSDVAILPLNAMNPMAKLPVLEAIDELIGFDADGAAAAAVDELCEDVRQVMTRAGPMQIADRRAVPVPVLIKAGLSVLDATGGWTNRAVNDFRMREGVAFSAERGWCVIPLWAQDHYTWADVQRETMTALYRLMFVLAHGSARTLGDYLAQEGYAQSRSGGWPSLDADDLAYTNAVLQPHLMATGLPTLIAALYGDTAAKELGYEPLGLSEGAGLALATANFRHG